MNLHENPGKTHMAIEIYRNLYFSRIGNTSSNGACSIARFVLPDILYLFEGSYIGLKESPMQPDYV